MKGCATGSEDAFEPAAPPSPATICASFPARSTTPAGHDASSTRTSPCPCLIIAVLLPLLLFGVPGLARMVLVHEGAEVVIPLNGLRAARTSRP